MYYKFLVGEDARGVGGGNRPSFMEYLRRRKDIPESTLKKLDELNEADRNKILNLAGKDNITQAEFDGMSLQEIQLVKEVRKGSKEYLHYKQIVLGELDNPAYLLSHTISKLGRDAALLNLFQNVREFSNVEIDPDTGEATAGVSSGGIPWIHSDDVIQIGDKSMTTSAAREMVTDMERNLNLNKSLTPEQRVEIESLIQQHNAALTKYEAIKAQKLAEQGIDIAD
jgi:hypothetical protein